MTSSSETAVDSIVSNVTVHVVVTGISYHYDQEVVISGVKCERETNIRDIRLSNIDLLNFCLGKEYWSLADNYYPSVEQQFKCLNYRFLFH